MRSTRSQWLLSRQIVPARREEPGSLQSLRGTAHPRVVARDHPEPRRDECASDNPRHRRSQPLPPYFLALLVEVTAATAGGQNSEGTPLVQVPIRSRRPARSHFDRRERAGVDESWARHCAHGQFNGRSDASTLTTIFAV